MCLPCFCVGEHVGLAITANKQGAYMAPLVRVSLKFVPPKQAEICPPSPQHKREGLGPLR